MCGQDLLLFMSRHHSREACFPRPTFFENQSVLKLKPNSETLASFPPSLLSEMPYYPNGVEVLKVDGIDRHEVTEDVVVTKNCA